MELTIEQALQQGVTAHKEGKLQDAERLYRAILQSQPLHPDANHNLGVIAVSVNKADAALPLFKTALEADPKIEQFWLSYIDALIKEQQFDNAKQVLEQAKTQGVTEEKLNNLEAQLPFETQIQNVNFANPPQERLSSLLECYQTGQYGDAEKLAVSITQEFPQHQFGWKVLGALLKQTGRVGESLVPSQKSAQIAPQDAEAHNNLGNTLKELGRLEEAEASYTQAIALKPRYAKAHSNLAKVLYELGYKDSALESIANANNIDPEEKEYPLILSVLKGRKLREESGVTIIEADALTGLASSPLILNRIVEPELINSLYAINSRELDNTSDARYGNGKCSSDFNLFQDSRSIIQNLAEHLTRLMMEAVKSDIYIYDSFFNILGAGGGSNPHNHIAELDKDSAFNLGKQKYSLVYYLSVGDQNCSEPGMLKLYEPSEDILPCEGMITIIRASRMHSAVYGGKTDRVMIGVNFYSI